MKFVQLLGSVQTREGCLVKLGHNGGGPLGELPLAVCLDLTRRDIADEYEQARVVAKSSGTGSSARVLQVRQLHHECNLLQQTTKKVKFRFDLQPAIKNYCAQLVEALKFSGYTRLLHPVRI
ncbi:hypothetical protein ACSFA3_21950 [Variovorax sp. RHLX14]|uniref:hypothetical protein n=1 Tax=Variovorax sp. RHLX14 TaxID=1259731 RepID=UPI003F465EED